MGITFNPITSQFDIKGNSGGGGPTVPPFEQTFNSTTDWGSPSGGLYTLTILATTHGKGINPLVHIFENSGLDFLAIGIGYKLNTSGDIIIEVLETPDNRFAGKAIIGD